MKQYTDSNLEKVYIKAVYCYPTYLTYMQSALCKMLNFIPQAGIKITGRNINNLRYTDDTNLMAESEELKSFLKRVIEESEKTGLKLSI